MFLVSNIITQTIELKIFKELFKPKSAFIVKDRKSSAGEFLTKDLKNFLLETSNKYLISNFKNSWSNKAAEAKFHET